MSTPFLELRGVTRRFGNTVALDRVNLELGDGELLVVLGPTGAGKTTLLRTIAGLEPIEAGTILMQGQDLSKLSVAQRDVALVFQNFSLYPDWSVRRNLEFPLRAPGRALGAEEIRERVAHSASLLGIEALLDRPARLLSGGEMQRVAIGRAIVRRPRLYLMDEPLTNLDAKLRETLRVELAVLARSLRVPMIYVTHDQGEALSMADRIAVLVAGKLQQVGAPREVYSRPISPLVARQLGQPEINFFTVRPHAGFLCTEDGTRLCASAKAESEQSLVGVRPEHIEVRTVAGAAGSDAQRTAVIELVENSGPHQILVTRWAGQRVHALADRSREFHVGDRVELRIEERNCVSWEAEPRAPGASLRAT